MPPETSKYVFCAGRSVAPAWSVSVEVSDTDTSFASVPPAMTSIG